MQASALVDAQDFPTVARFLDRHVEMQFADLRVMLQLPWGEFNAGCNFAAATVMLNLLSGFSVCLFEASKEALEHTARRGPRFKSCLQQYYPWNGEECSSEQASQWLYQIFRNPLVHSLGVLYPLRTQWSGIKKWPLSLADILEMESGPQRPDWLPLTFEISRSPSGETHIVLSCPSLYWGTWRVLEKLCKDFTQMSKAEELLENLQI